MKEHLTCIDCKFWSKHKREGTCSQVIKTTDNMITKQITYEDYYCSLAKELNSTTSFSINLINHLNEGNKSIEEFGSCNNINILSEMIEFLQRKIDSIQTNTKEN